MVVDDDDDDDYDGGGGVGDHLEEEQGAERGIDHAEQCVRRLQHQPRIRGKQGQKLERTCSVSCLRFETIELIDIEKISEEDDDFFLRLLYLGEAQTIIDLI